MKRSLSVNQVVFHPSTLAVFSGLLGAIIGFLLNRASGGNTSQVIWIALIFAILFSLSITAWQGYRQEQTGRQWMTMLQRCGLPDLLPHAAGRQARDLTAGTTTARPAVENLHWPSIKSACCSFSVTTACPRRLSAMPCKEALASSGQTSRRP